jgi:hypothetical protein
LHDEIDAAGKLPCRIGLLIQDAPERCDSGQRLALLMLFPRQFCSDAKENPARQRTGEIRAVSARQVLKHHVAHCASPSDFGMAEPSGDSAMVHHAISTFKHMRSGASATQTPGHCR